MKTRDLVQMIGDLFTKRQQLVSFWQELAENFYPQRADFTYTRTVGKDFAENLTSSYPLLVARELSSQVGMMLRPTEREWFYMQPEDEDRQTHDAKRWLEFAVGVQRRAMYDRVTQFTRAAKEADADFSVFGQYVMSVRLNRMGDALLYRVWHLRDCVWVEDEEGEVILVARKWKPQAIDLKRDFGDKVSGKLDRLLEKTPFQPVECLHVIMQPELWEGDARGRPWVSMYIDTAHDNHVLEELPQWTREYIVPRWQTVSGSQYAYSPATVAGLPDARLLQGMTYTLLEAGEKVTNPPMVATTEVVKSDMAIYAGGTTWVDRDYDERLGAALRPIQQDYRGLPFGMDMLQDTRSMLAEAFYLNKLTLPQRAPEMTAYEVGQRIQEYIRGALPLFEPMEYESNGQLCEMTFETLLRAGAFGSALDVPSSLRGADVPFRYRSPLHDAVEASRAETFRSGAQLLAEAASVDQSVTMIPNAAEALRDTLDGLGWPAEWIRSEEEVQAMREAQQQAEQAQQALAMMDQGSQAAKQFSEAQLASAQAEGAGV